MFMSIRSYRVRPDQRDEVVRRVDDGWADQLKKQSGFVAYYVVASGPEELVSMTACLSEEALKRVVEASAEWVGGHLMDLDVTLTEEREGRVESHVG